MGSLRENELAEHYFQQAYAHQMRGELDEAVRLYRKSIEVYPTAEAHTFLGWTYSFMGRPDEAIRECEVAIQVDPDFGNPYNDIGAYLIELGRLDEAIPWFHRAMAAQRYEPRHYPHMNLARVWIKKGRIDDAIAELRRAAALAPEYAPARRELHRLLGMLN
jgi:Tfp pilus assembly protein PilF